MLYRPWLIPLITFLILFVLILVGLGSGSRSIDIGVAQVPMFQFSAGWNQDGEMGGSWSERFRRNVRWAVSKGRQYAREVVRSRSAPAEVKAAAPAVDLTAEAEKLAAEIKRKTEAQKKKKKKRGPHFEVVQVGRKAGDRARALSPVAENQESPAPGVGRPPRSGGADADKVDEKSTAEYWINVIARNPSPENQTALLDAYNRGTFSESVFIQIIEALLLDSSSDARAIGFTALQNNPSAAAFGLLIGILDDRVPARGLGADAQQILNGYARSESLFILSQVLGASRESLALIKATRFVQSIARLKLQLVQADEDALTTSVLTSSEWRIFGSIQGYLKKILDERGSGDEVAVAANETLPTVEELVALQGPSEASLN